MNIATFDRIFTTTLAKTSKQKKQEDTTTEKKDQKLDRHGFLEMIVRLTQVRYSDKINESMKKRYAYQQQIDVFTLADLFITFVTDDILPNY